MIIKEFYKTRKDGVNLFRTFSDAGKKIRKVGTNEVYDAAIDVGGARFTYEETDIPVEIEKNDAKEGGANADT